jgi:nucleolar GTP-binding protein
VSGSCGYTIAQQAALFHSIKALFMNKPLIVVCNKTDLQPMDGISEEDKKLVAEMKAEAMKTVLAQGGEPTDEEGVLLTMSTLTEEGVIAVKNAACERLLNQRVELKMKSKKINDCLNRFHVAMPKQRDDKERPSCIPAAVLEAKAKQAEKEKRKTEKDLEEENGGAGVYSASLKKHYILADDDWKEDILPEILDGHNVYDFIDPDILLRLEELEREEGIRQAEEAEEDFEMDGEELTEEEKKALAAIRRKKTILIQEHRIKKSTAESRSMVPRKFDKDKKYTPKRMGRQLSALGIDPSKAIDRARSRSVSRGRKRERSVGNNDDAMDMDVDDQANKKLRVRSTSRSRSKSRAPTEEGLRDEEQRTKAIKLFKKSAKKRNKNARKGEADRVIPTLRPKHLFSGKRSIGKTDRR